MLKRIGSTRVIEEGRDLLSHQHHHHPGIVEYTIDGEH
jgi:hypothetical protein